MPGEIRGGATVISALREHELEEAGSLLDRAFGRQGMLWGLKTAFALPKGVWLAARSPQGIVGMVGAVTYGSIASVGMVGVDPEVQRRGIALELMTRLLARLDDLAGRITILEATEAGEPLYLKLGFRSLGRTLRMEASWPPSPAIVGKAHETHADPWDTPREPLAKMRAWDLSDVIAYDGRCFGEARPALLRSHFAGRVDRSFVVRDRRSRLVGFALASAGGRLGPWAAETPASASALLDALRELPWPEPVGVTLPEDNRAGVEMLLRSGFCVSQTLCHMQRGGLGDPRHVTTLYGQASLALG